MSMDLRLISLVVTMTNLAESGLAWDTIGAVPGIESRLRSEFGHIPGFEEVMHDSEDVPRT